MIIRREKYLKRIKGYVDKPVIKVISGMRRTGKSYLIRQVIDMLSEEGVAAGKVLYINKELLEFDFIKDYKDLHEYVSGFFKGKKGYLFIDEVQEIAQWEKAVGSFFAEQRYDIYITGSNSGLLSSELSTLLSGRYIEIKIFTLGFDEFLLFRGKKARDKTGEFNNYLKFGGFPVIHNFDLDEELTYQYINSLFDTIILKDVISRYNIRNVKLFLDIVRFVFDNIGNVFSAHAISKYLKSQHQKIGVETIQNYLMFIESSYMLYKVRRYDLKGKKLLDVHEKYFIGDTGLKNALLGFKEADISGMLENIVFLHLLRENYKVSIGKLNGLEVDFIAEKQGFKVYIQVAYLLDSEKTREREFRVLQKIKDNHPKFLLSMDNLPLSNNAGIIRMNLIDFLLNSRRLG